jgi:hypothetical protein
MSGSPILEAFITQFADATFRMAQQTQGRLRGAIYDYWQPTEDTSLLHYTQTDRMVVINNQDDRFTLKALLEFWGGQTAFDWRPMETIPEDYYS